MTGLIGIKCGTSRLVNESGETNQVTVILVQPNYVTGKKEGNSLQLASIPKKKSVGRCEAGQFKKLNIDPQSKIREFVFSKENYEKHELGSQLDVDAMSSVGVVSVTGTSIGKGFAGCVKRWNFSMQRATHGNSLSHRAPGSIGQCQDPGRVIKGKKMAGRLGGVQRTVKGLKVMRIDKEKGLLIVKGSVPGYDGSVVYVREQKEAGK
ncbi:MAG: 50S ribosomal protein L3 [Pseudomonadota bacterium]|nr:50S ribosomal protein L3 [Pseudomonadota bacterium]